MNDKLRSTVNTRENPEKPKIKTPVKVSIAISMIMLLLLLGGGYLYFLQAYSEIDYKKIPESNENLGIADEVEDEINIFDTNKSIINILLLGVDKRDKNERGRSDSMMILSIDPIRNQIKLSSLMRDSRVSIKGHDLNKLGHAYSYGGPELSIHTINDNFRMNIRHYASINYGGLVNIIDSVGGVMVNIELDEIAMVNKYISDTAYVEGLDFTPVYDPGYQLLNGVQAVGYSRIRKTGDGDYERTQRQRIVLSAVIRKLTKLNITELPKVIRELAPNIETNITAGYMLKVSRSILSTGMSDIRQARFPSNENSYGENIRGTWYLIFDKYKTIDELHDFIFEN